jgi:DNA polymerase sigma
MQLTDLKPIVMVLKKLLQNNNLNSPYLGGLCSYSLVLMTSTFLKQQNANSMPINLTEFLNYYGNYFNPSTTQLNGETFYHIFEVRQDPMIVNDPLN